MRVHAAWLIAARVATFLRSLRLSGEAGPGCEVEAGCEVMPLRSENLANLASFPKLQDSGTAHRRGGRSAPYRAISDGGGMPWATGSSTAGVTTTPLPGPAYGYSA